MEISESIQEPSGSSAHEEATDATTILNARVEYAHRIAFEKINKGKR